MAFTFNPDTQPQDKFKFVVGLRFELFYALQTLTYNHQAACDESRSCMHLGWKEETLQHLPDSFHDNFKALGGSPHFWPAIADALEHCPIEASFNEIMAYLKNQDPAEFRDAILIGTLHDPKIVEGLVTGKHDLRAVSEDAPEAEHKWLEFLGLRPYHTGADIVKGLNSLIHTPEAFKTTLIDTLKTLWDVSLESVWAEAYPKLVASLEEKRQLFETYALAEFLERALGSDKTVSMKWDIENKTLVCCKGHIRIPLQNLGNFYLMPSIFNSMRFWTFYENGDYTTVFLPYFEPDIVLVGDPKSAEAELPTSEAVRPFIPQMDPALIFKALGDNTRYAIVSHIAQNPRTSAELSKILKVSKPTISHHVQLLREAGLLHEEPSSRSVQLSLKRDIIEHLSEATVGSLFNGVRL